MVVIPASGGPPSVRTRTKRVVLDSRDRDVEAFPTPNAYEVRLPDDIQDVSSVRLLAADLPFSRYDVHADNNAVPVRVALLALAPGSYAGPADVVSLLQATMNAASSPTGSTVAFTFATGAASTGLDVDASACGDAWTLKRKIAPMLLGGPTAVVATYRVVAGLQVGDYGSAAEVAAELQTKLGDATTCVSASMAVAHVARTDSFVVRASKAFALDFAAAGAAGTAARLLGFSPGAAYSSTDDGSFELVRAPYRCDLSKDAYIVMQLSPSAELVMSANNPTNRVFAVIPRVPRVDQSEHDYIKEWSPPLARVSKVGLRFADYHGRPYDFQNQDHRVELLFTYAVNRKYVV